MVEGVRRGFFEKIIGKKGDRAVTHHPHTPQNESTFLSQMVGRMSAIKM